MSYAPSSFVPFNTWKEKNNNETMMKGKREGMNQGVHRGNGEEKKRRS